MKRLLKFITALTIIVSIVLILTPLGINIWLSQGAYRQWISTFSKQYDIPIKVTSFKRGWFTSHATLSFQPDKKTTLYFNQIINTGPLLFLPKRGLTFDVASIDSVGTSDQFPLKMNSLMSFRGHHHTQFTANKIVFNHTAQPITANHLNGQLTLKKGRFNATIKAKQLRIGDDTMSRSIQAKGVVITDSSNQQPNLSEKEQTFSAHSVQFTQPGQPGMSINHAKIGINKKTGSETTDISYHINAQSIALPNMMPGALHAQISLTELNNHALNELFKVINHTGEKQSPEKILKIYLSISNLLTHGIHINLDQLSFTTPKGPIQFKGNAIIPAKTGNEKRSNPFGNIAITIHAKVPQRWFLSRLTEHYLSIKSTSSQSESDNNDKKSDISLAKKSAYTQTIKWLSKKAILSQGNRILFTLILESGQWYLKTANQQLIKVSWHALPSEKINQPNKTTTRNRLEKRKDIKTHAAS